MVARCVLQAVCGGQWAGGWASLDAERATEPLTGGAPCGWGRSGALGAEPG